jgi:hypothetical protein
MNCPRCGGAVEEGAPACPACGLELEWTDEPEEGDAQEDLVCVLRVTDPAVLPVLTSLLQAEGIPVALQNDAGTLTLVLQDEPYPWSARHNPTRVMVPRSCEQAARALVVAQLSAPAEDEHDAEGGTKRS